MSSEDASIHPLSEAVAEAADQQVMRIVAIVDSMARRGPADLLIEPLRRRLAALRPPRPLRFCRLMFHPLDIVIVPAARWRPQQPAIPRTALMPMAKFVRLAMGPAATAIEASLVGRTTADTELIPRLGRSLWPAAAEILLEMPIPRTWDSTQLGERHYRPLADAVAALLRESVAIDTLHAEAATGLLPPRPKTIAAILNRVGRVNEHALPMVVAMLLDRLPHAADLLRPGDSGVAAACIDAAVDLLLRQLDQDEGVEQRIAIGSLAEAGAAAGRMITLLAHLDRPDAGQPRRDQVRALRQRLDANCRARFASGLREEILAPLQAAAEPDTSTIQALEEAARGLRMLETEARVIGGGATYDGLLSTAAEAIEGDSTPNALPRTDRLRLIEILLGPDAALAALHRPTL